MKVDLSSMYKIINEKTNELKMIDRAIRRFAQNAAAYERANHLYKNRTGNLEKSTIGKVTKSGDEIEASLQMNMDYASYVVNRGFSKIDEAAEMLENDIEDYLQRLGTTFE